MRGKFAHISDSHIGAWRDPKLREINDAAFGSAVDACVREGVDFVLISGEIFDDGIPEMASVRSAVRKLRKLADGGIAAYVVYGSHDYSPTTVSVVDVLTSAGLFVNVGEYDVVAAGQGNRDAPAIRRIEIKPVVDEKTGAVIAGLPARRMGLETSLYSSLGARTQSTSAGKFSVFVFHASINELQSLNIPIEQTVSLTDLPGGFSYYAGGHLHKRVSGSVGGAPVVYPGPLFGTSYADLELTARGERRGFALVEFEGAAVSSVRFVSLELPRIVARTFSAQGKSAAELGRDISRFVSREELDVKGAIVLLKARGVLASGKPSEVDWFGYRRELLDRGALVVNLNRMGLTSHESRKLAGLPAASKEEIEASVLREHLAGFKAADPVLARLAAPGEGASVAARLLRAFKAEKTSGETRHSFEARVWREASEILEFPTGEALSPAAGESRRGAKPQGESDCTSEGKDGRLPV